ncbi:MAG: hypothetical protein N2116_00485 [Armatimonadetes bacterium]|nr:hypothetical protein [Armatimonadota bacterium]
MAEATFKRKLMELRTSKGLALSILLTDARVFRISQGCSLQGCHYALEHIRRSDRSQQDLAKGTQADR